MLNNMSNKAKTFALSLFLTLTLAITLVALPVADAATANTRQTYAFCGVIPNHTGVGQSVTLHVGILEPTTHPQEGWVGLSVTVTKPNGDTETIRNINTDTTGGTGISYTPDQVGTYYFQTHFPEQVMLYAGSDTPANTTMLASDSEKVPLYVTEEPVKYYPGVPLPTEYWTRPIDSQLREWSLIAGNWLTSPSMLSIGNKVALSNDAPETAHILWARNDLAGSGAGLVGGEEQYDAHGYYTGDAYEGKFSGSVIIAGVLYYNRHIAGGMMGGGGALEQNVVAVDLHTGEELWVRNWNNTRLSFGQILYWDTGNGHGAYSYLWATSGGSMFGGAPTWDAYDPLDGSWVFGLRNVPSGTRVYGPNGEILIYTVDPSNSRLLRWNSTWAVKYYDQYDPTNPFSSAYARFSWLAGHSSLMGTVMDASHGYDLNVSIAGLPGSVVAVLGDRIIGSNIGGMFGGSVPTNTVVWGISTKAGQEGTLLFNATWASPTAWISGNQTISWVGASSDDLVGALWSKEARQFYGVSLETGQLLWGPTQPQYYLDAWTSAVSAQFAYGKMYECGTAGTLYCFDAQTGDLLWNYNATDTYVEYKIGPNWWLSIDFISDGKIYVGHYEHSSGDPKPRGAPYICINATDGSVIWSIDGAFRQTSWGGMGIIGDSIIATMDTYDQKIYAIGKGPSATTVTAPDNGIPLGSSIMIRGTVTDVSPGTNDDALKLRFPNGVPAVSDDSMSDWMLYVYKQFPKPTNATGVEVVLSVLDANNNFREIGRTTSDSNGFFSFAWKPDIPGAYTLYASFAGSKSYWPSFAETSFVVDEAPPATPTATPITGFATTGDLLTYMTVGVIAIIIAIVIVGVLMLRKRP